jgi:hypothetical protein
LAPVEKELVLPLVVPVVLPLPLVLDGVGAEFVPDVCAVVEVVGDEDGEDVTPAENVVAEAAAMKAASEDCQKRGMPSTNAHVEEVATLRITEPGFCDWPA